MINRRNLWGGGRGGVERFSTRKRNGGFRPLGTTTTIAVNCHYGKLNQWLLLTPRKLADEQAKPRLFGRLKKSFATSLSGKKKDESSSRIRVCLRKRTEEGTSTSFGRRNRPGKSLRIEGWAEEDVETI